MTATDVIRARHRADWVVAIRCYLLFVVPTNLFWEIAHLPLYTIWQEPLGRKAFAVFHCTLGDALIAMSTLVIAIVLFGSAAWPSRSRTFRRVAAATITIAVAYTIFSEWLNVSVRGSWDYSESMPRLPWIGTGLSALLQWIVIPTVGFVFARRMAMRVSKDRAAAFGK